VESSSVGASLFKVSAPIWEDSSEFFQVAERRKIWNFSKSQCLYVGRKLCTKTRTVLRSSKSWSLYRSGKLGFSSSPRAFMREETLNDNSHLYLLGVSLFQVLQPMEGRSGSFPSPTDILGKSSKFY